MSGIAWKSSAWRQLMELPVPKWIPRSLRGQFPRSRLKLSCGPTALNPWLTLENGREVFIKRDDQTGSSLSGNKVRKLEFIMADLLKKGHDTVITCGALQSNHCRAVAIIAAQLGIECHLLLRTNLTSLSELPSTGNFLLGNLAGSYQYLVGAKEPYLSGLLPRAQKLAEVLRRGKGRKSYIVPVGGSDLVGLYGYFMAFDEILQECPSSVRNIFVACGSGGTLAGLAIANHLTGTKFRIYGIPVCDNAAYFYDHAQKMLNDLGLTNVAAENICHVIDCYKGAGYGISSNQERELIARIAAKTGIYLDPVYTGKAVRGMLAELQSGSDLYEGDSLFIHTGGIFGIFGQLEFCKIEKSRLAKTSVWEDANQEPFIF